MFVEEKTERVSMQELAYQLREELKPVTKLFKSFEENNEFLVVKAYYFPLSEVDTCLQGEKLDHEYVTDYCPETKTYRPEKRLRVNVSDEYMRDDPKSLEDLTDNDFTTPWDGFIQVDFQLGETYSRGFFITTGEGLKYLERRYPDIHRGLTQRADGMLDQGSFSIDGYKFETYKHPSKASWRRTKRDYVEGKRVDGEWLEGYWYDAKHTDYETDNFVWWFYEWNLDAVELIEWERTAWHTLPSARSEEDKEKIEKYLKGVDGQRKKKVFAHSVQQQSRPLCIKDDILREVLEHIDLGCFFFRRY